MWNSKSIQGHVPAVLMIVFQMNHIYRQFSHFCKHFVQSSKSWSIDRSEYISTSWELKILHWDGSKNLLNYIIQLLLNLQIWKMISLLRWLENPQKEIRQPTTISTRINGCCSKRAFVSFLSSVGAGQWGIANMGYQGLKNCVDKKKFC